MIAITPPIGANMRGIGAVPSTIAWLDTSREEQRRMREVINLFAQTESRDELGIGQVRDGFSDRLFPGTSTLHTRARYLLLIPWCYREAARLARDSEDLPVRAAQLERRLIVALNDAQAWDGLIGRNVLTKLKTLPSALYWSALTQWNVLAGEPADDLLARTWHRESDEIVERARLAWNTLPVPPNFPVSTITLDLSPEEASWVRERMLSGSEGSLLSVLLQADRDDWLQLPAPWDVPVTDAGLSRLLEDARLFSLVAEGAGLSYNLAVARRYEAFGLTHVQDPVQFYVQAIGSWVEALEPERGALRAWDRSEFWSAALQQNPRISWGTRLFIDSWVEQLNAGSRPDDTAALTLASEREKVQKRSQSRLVNDKLLRTWSGAAGTARLTYRWGNVTRLLTDVHEGLHRAAS